MIRFRRISFALTAALFTMAFIVPMGTEAAKARVSVVGSGPGTTIYVMYGGLAALVTENSKTVQMSNQTTRGAVEDLRLIEAGKADFGLGVATLVLRAQQGKKPYKKKYTRLRGFGPASVSMFQVATYQSSGITKVSQLNGKTVSFARKGGNAYFMLNRLMKHAGIKVRREHLPFSAAPDAMKDNRIQAFGIPLPVPGPAFVKAAAAAPINLLPIEGATLQRFLKDSPAYTPVMIPAGSYNGIDKPVPTIGYTAWTVTGAHVPNDVVYEVARINFSKRGRAFLPKVHRGWVAGFKAAPALDQMEAIRLKIHPGAARYWREKGHKIPAAIQ